MVDFNSACHLIRELCCPVAPTRRDVDTGSSLDMDCGVWQGEPLSAFDGSDNWMGL
jgi:hypothetical protein